MALKEHHLFCGKWSNPVYKDFELLFLNKYGSNDIKYGYGAMT